MAKKEKKQKKEKPQKRGKKQREKESPNIPYPGSDRTKTFLAKLLVVLCAVVVGLMIYTIHYFRFINAKAQDAAIAVAEAERAAIPPAGDPWFLQADGTYTRADGTPIPTQEPDGQTPAEQPPAEPDSGEEPGEPEAGEPEASGQEPEEPAQSEQNI